jgi:endonuclease YncB( thermonuclease family)
MTPSRCKTFIPTVVLLSVLVQASMPSFSGEIIRGRVVGVHDGDTLTLLTGSNRQVKIRLAQIDAPESDQAFGQISRQALAGRVLNKMADIAVETIDANGRIVGKVVVDGVDVNREQVRSGMAWAYRQYLHDPSLLQLEGQARRAGAGLWSDANPMAPWVYRHGGSEGSEQRPPLPQAPLRQADSSCGGKRTCKDMDSCEEAQFYLSHCGVSGLDGDRDGIPCERLCGHGE